MLDREIVLTGKGPDKTAQKPAAGIAWVERQRALNQPDHGADILAEKGQHQGGVGEDARVVLRHLKRLPGKISGLMAVCLQRCGPTVGDEQLVAGRRPGKRRPVMPIDRDRLLEQPESRENPLFRYRIESRKRTQIEIVGGEVGRWPRGRISAACNAGSITPATLIATLSCRSNTPSSDLRSRLPLEGDRP